VIGPEEREIGTPQELEKLNRSFPLEQKAIKKQEFADATAVGLPSAFATAKDTGSGTDPEMVSKLLSKFTTKSLKGTGLGLYLQEYC
jgi:signal transduction histidine kinase